MTQQTKSQELAIILRHLPAADAKGHAYHADAAAHILAQEAEIERLKITQYGSGRLQALRDERHQARDALRVAVESLEDCARTMLAWSVSCQDGVVKRCQCKKCVTKRSEVTIKQAKEALK